LGGGGGRGGVGGGRGGGGGGRGGGREEGIDREEGYLYLEKARKGGNIKHLK